MKYDRYATTFVLLIAGTLGAIPGAFGQGLKVTRLAFPSATGTYATGVNKLNHVTGLYTANGANGAVTEGFEWLGASSYKKIIFPKSKAFTRALAINDSGEIVGDFIGQDSFYHGFTDVGGTLTQYDVPGGKGHFNTSLFAIDNNGDLAGSANGQGFVSIGGTVTMFYASGTDVTYAYGINDSGVAVGQYFDSSGNTHGFMWQAGTITEIIYPGATQTACEGINDAGEITGYYYDTSGVGHGFTDKSGVFATSDMQFIEGVSSTGSYTGWYVGPPNLPYGYVATPIAFNPTAVKVRGAESTSTLGVNNAGVLVGQYTNAKGVTHGMMLNGTTVTNFDDPNAVAGTTYGNGINSSNQIVGYYVSSATGQLEAFYWAGGTFTEIPGPAGSVSATAYNINDAGQIAGTFYDASAQEHGFILSGPGGTYTQLDVPGATYTYAWGINNAGTVTVGWGDPSGFEESSLYSGGTYTSINLAGVANGTIHSINSNGDVVYSWADASGNFHGGLVSGGVSYLLDVPGADNTRGDGINDSGLIVGRNFQPGSTTNYNGFKGAK